MGRIGVGVEIECIYDRSIFDLSRGDYHDEESRAKGGNISGLSGWDIEGDGSLNTHGEFSGGSTAEIVSPLFIGINKFREGLNSFKNYFSKNGTLELNKALAFNDTCGSHVHFSIDGFSFTDMAVFKVFQEARDLFFEKIKDSHIRSRETILTHYFRYYAEQIYPENRIISKYYEFNFRSEQNGYGLEWRSLNMRDIKTWAEFDEFWDIVCSCLELLAEKSKHYSYEDSISLGQFSIQRIKTEHRITERVFNYTIPQEIRESVQIPRRRNRIINVTSGRREEIEI